MTNQEMCEGYSSESDDEMSEGYTSEYNDAICKGYSWDYDDCPGCNFKVDGCRENCVYAPLFYMNGNEDIAAAFRVFGVTAFQPDKQHLANVKEIRTRTILFEAKARVYDPVYGTTGIVISLHKRLRAATRELEIANRKLSVPSSATTVEGQQSHPFSDQNMMPNPKRCQANCPGCNHPVMGFSKTCVYGPMFFVFGYADEPDMPAAFSIFGVIKFESSQKLLEDVSWIQKRTVLFEANARDYDRVYGTIGIVLSLHKKLGAVTRELDIAIQKLSEVNVPSSATTVQGQHRQHLPSSDAMTTTAEINYGMGTSVISKEAAKTAEVTTDMGTSKISTWVPSLPATSVPIDDMGAKEFTAEEMWANSCFRESSDASE